MSAMTGGGAAQHLPGQRLALVLGQVHRRAGQHLHQVAREQVGLLAAVREDVLRAPVRDRDHRGAGGQRQPGDAGLAHHRPQVRVAGGGALRVEDQALARRQAALGVLESDHERRVGAGRGAPATGRSARRNGPSSFTSNAEDLMRKAG